MIIQFTFYVFIFQGIEISKKCFYFDLMTFSSVRDIYKCLRMRGFKFRKVLISYYSFFFSFLDSWDLNKNSNIVNFRDREARVKKVSLYDRPTIR